MEDLQMTLRIGNDAYYECGSDQEAWRILGGESKDFPGCREIIAPEAQVKEVKKEPEDAKTKISVKARKSISRDGFLKRNLSILDYYNFGKYEVKVIAREFDLTYNVVCMILGRRMPSRSENMLNDFYKNGLSRVEIAEKYHIAPAYVGKILRYSDVIKIWNETKAIRERSWNMIKDGFKVY